MMLVENQTLNVYENVGSKKINRWEKKKKLCIMYYENYAFAKSL